MTNVMRRTLAVPFRSASPVVLRFLAAALVLLACLPHALAQSATATALTVTPTSGASGSIFSLAAAVSSGGAAVTGGTVKFTDSYNGMTIALGSAQVQSANGTPGAAVLNIALAGGGAHSITASFIGNTSYAASASSAQSVTLTSGYPTAVTLGTSGGTGNYTLTAALSGVGNGTPTGDLTFNDTTAGTILETVALNTLSFTSSFGAQQTYGTGNGPDAVALGDFNGDGKLDLVITNVQDSTVSVLLGNGDGAFQTQVTYAVGSDPEAIAVGDFNGDGKLDLAIANYGGKTVSVLLGNGDGTFQTQVTYAVGSDPKAVAVGDFNGDGNLDLAVANYATSGTVSVLLGNGNGTFQTQITYAVGNRPDAIAVGDFNGDGKLDLGVANRSASTVSVLLGNGDGTFQKQVTYTVGSGPYSVAVGDFNGDGKLDLVVGNGNGTTVSVLLGNGDGTFQTQVTYAVGDNPYGIVVGDFNGDGIPDLAVANEGGATVGVLLGNGDGTFQTQVTYAVGNSPEAIAVGDFNGDERLDLAVANNSDNTASVLLGEWATSSTVLTSVVLPGSGTQAVNAEYSGDSSFSSSTSASVNLVGGAEPTTTTTLSVNPASGSNTTVFTFTAAVQASNRVVVLGGTVTLSDSYNGLTTILGTVQVQAANGTAVLSTKLPAGSHSVTAIFNGFDSDLPSTSAAQTVTVTGTYATSTALASSGVPGNYTLTATVEGFGNGTPTGNVAFNDTTAGVPLGTVSLSSSTLVTGFAPQQVYAVGNSPDAVAVGDFNGDGIPDLAIANQSDATVSVLLGNGDGAFQTQVTYAVGSQPSAIAVGDFNGDGKLDLAVVNKNGSTVSILLGNGDGTFQTQVTYAVGSNPLAIAVGDFNGDGKLDLAVANQSANTVSILLGNGDGTFQTQVTYAVGDNPNSIVVGDFNGDGKLDLAVANANSSTVSVLLGNGDGTFQTQVTYAVGSDPDGIAVGDFNGDGKQDLAVANERGSSVSMLLGNGDGTFQTQVTYAVGGDPDAIAVGDFNGDGKLDLAVANANSSTVSVLLGNGDGTFQTQVTYAVGSDPDGIAVGDFNGDGKPDLAVINYVDNGDDPVVGIMLGDVTGTAALTNVSVGGTGTHQISATYAGDSNFSTSTSSTVSLLAGQITTALTLTATPASALVEQSVALTATLNPYSDGTLNTNGETVTFLNGTTTLGTGTLSSGVATLTTTALPTGTDSLTAVYAGDASFAGVTSSAVSYVVTPPPATTTMLTVSPTSASTGSVFTLTASIASGGTVLPGGTVVFQDTYNGVTTTLGTMQAQSANGTPGSAVLLTTLAGAGTHSITATLDALEFYQSSTSLPQTVTLSGTYATTTALASSGSAGNYTLTATVAGFGRGTPTGNVTFSDTTAGTTLETAGLSSSTLASTLAAPLNTASGGGDEAVAVGDFNRDGVPDIAVLGANNVYILLGNGNGTFQAPVSYNATDAAGNNPLVLLVGDFNNDGKLDLATGNDFVLLGNGDGTFAPLSSLNNFNLAATAGDFNGDGILDMATVNGVVYLGSGTGTFPTQKVTTIGTASNWYSVANGDFNGDGKLDLATTYMDANGDYWIAVALGNGDGTFQTPVQYATTQPGSSYNGLAVGDVNGDGRPDLVIMHNGQIGVLLGNGDGTFQTETTYPVGGAATSVALADFNGDGKLDAVVEYGSSSSGSVALLLGNGDGTFQAPVTFPVGDDPWGIAAVDVNGDGRPDVININLTSSASTVSVLLGEVTEVASLTGVSIPGSGPAAVDAAYAGDGSFNASVSSAVQLTGSQITTALALSASTSSTTAGQQVTLTATLSPYSNRSFTTNGEMVTFLSGTTTLGSTTLANGVAILTTTALPQGTDSVTANYPGDSNFTSSLSLPVLITVGAAGPAPATTILTASPASGTTGSIFTLTAVPLGTGGAIVNGGTVTFYDTYNGVTSPLGTAQVRTASGYAVLKTALGGAGTHSLTASYGGDNTSSASTSTAQTVTITGLFSSTTTIASSGTVGDYTLTATVTGIGNGTPTSSVAFNDTSTGTALGTVALSSATFSSGFGAWQGFVSGASLWPNGVATGDFNGDGIPDLVVPSLANGSIGILLGNGNGTFQPQVNYATGNQPVAVAVGDFNGDGKLDVAVTTIGYIGNGTVSVLLGNGDGTFQPQVAYAVGDLPLAITVGDFNGDGKPDLAVANFAEDTVSVLLGNGDGTFQAATRLVAGSQPMAITVGDVNGDGKLDLLVGNVGNGTVSVLLGNGDGTFQPQKTAPATPQPIGIAVGDFNGDGKLDIAVANSTDGWVNEDINEPDTNAIGILLGNGDGTFQAPVQYATTGTANAIATADINKDGKLDLVVTNGEEFGGSTFNLFLGNGDGTFQAPLTYATGNNPLAVAVADFNGDGLPDVAVQGGGEVNISLGQATETATLANVYVPGSGNSEVDAAYSGNTNFAGSTSPSILLKAGQIVTTLTLTAAPIAAAPGQPVALTATLSPATVGSETANGATITFLNGTTTLGTETLTGGAATLTTSSLALGPNPIQAVFAGAAPFNASTSVVDTIIIAPATATTLKVSPGSGATGSVFTLTASVQSGGTAVSLGSVTFQDSYNGITRTLGTAQIQTASQAATLKTTLAGAGSHSITAAFDGTGTGVASASAAQPVTVTGGYATTTAFTPSGLAGDYTLTATVTGYGNPTPTGNVAFNDTTSGANLGNAALSQVSLATSFLVPPLSSSSVPAGGRATIIGDFNGDGIPDVATISSNSSSSEVMILLGKGDGTFQAETTTFATGTSPVAIAAGDFNGDGKLDLVTANYGVTGGGTTISVLLGNGDGTFQPQVTYNVGNTPYAIAVADFNGDGKLDLAVANVEGDTVSILLGNGDGTFKPQVAYGVQTPYSIAVGDFNGDGKPDLAIASPQINEVSILLGNGDGTFKAVVEYPAGSGPTTIFAGDFNGDGKQDVIAGNVNGASVLLGNGDGTFQSQVAYSESIIYDLAQGGEPISSMAVGDLNGDGKPDLIYVTGDVGAGLNSNGTFQANGYIIVGFGNGDGTFQAPVTYAATSVSPVSIALGDFNGDGRLDLAVADNEQSQSTQSGTDIYLNTLTETATLTGVYATGSGAQTVDAAYAGDTNFGGSTSASATLASGIATTVTVTASPATSTPGAPVTLTATLAPWSIGNLTTNGETITFLSGTTTLGKTTLSGGVATLTTTSLPLGADSITAVYAGDTSFGGSTSPAFLVYVVSASATGLTVSPGTGATGSVFTLSATVQSNGGAVTSGAVTFTDNYNGLTTTLGTAQIQASSGAAVLKTTLAGPGTHNVTASFGGVAASGPSLSGAQTVTLSGLLATTTTLASSGTAGDYTLTATVAGYGNSAPTGNVVFTDTTGGVTLGSAPLSASSLISGFGALQTFVSETNSNYLVTGDFNNDGILDVAVVSALISPGQVAIQLGNGDGTFQAPKIMTLSIAVSDGGFTVEQPMVAGDFNGDGKLDLAIIGANSIGVLLGDGDGTFQPEVNYAIGSNPGAVAVGDFNGDGKPDLVVSDGSISVLLGNGDGTFQPEVGTAITGGGNGGIAVGDFNGDGKLDVATGGQDVFILLGNGNGTFQSPLAYSTGYLSKPSQIATADFNGDGKLDIVTDSKYDHSLSVLLGNGNGTFQSPLTIGFVDELAMFAIGDFNGDGKLDLAGPTGILYGNGDGTFVPSTVTYVTDSSTTSGTSWIAAGDFNGDGKLDIAAISFNGLSVLLGQQIETATLTGVSVPGSGTPSVNAAYSGDTNFGSSSSSPITLTASQIATTLALTASAPPSNSSQVTLVAILSPASDGNLSTNGETVTFLNGSTTIGTATLNSGVATLVTTSIPAGATNLTASYPGDANFLASQSAPTSVVLKAVLLVTANSLTKAINQPNPTLAYTITGFVNGDTQASATTGAPSLTTTATQSSPAGSYPITITQSTLAAPNYNFTFVNGTLTVVGNSQTITFPALANVVYNSTPIPLSATASSNLPVTYSVTGPATLSGSTLTLTGVGTVTVTANQVGNGTYAAATAVSQSFIVSPAVLTATASSLSRAYGTANPALTYVLTGFVGGDTQTSATTGAPALTTTATQTSALGTYPITITQGTLAAQNYTFTLVNGTLTVAGVPLTVSANSTARLYGAANPTFTGSVVGAQNGDTFTESFTTTATATSSPGSYPIVPTAVGTNLSNYTVTTVNGILTIAQAPTAVALTANNTTSASGSAVIFTAQVAPTTVGTPTGTVSFYSGSTLLGTGELNSGQATYSASTLAIGSYAITAAYGGDVNFTGNTSPALTETIVTQGTFTLGPQSGSGSQTISAGGTATFTIVVNPNGVVTSPITFSATGLPPGATSTFSPATLIPGSSATSTTLTIQTAAQTAAANQHRKSGSEVPLLAFATGLLMLPLFRIRAVRRRLGRLSDGFAVLLFLAFSLGALVGISGCGGGGGSMTSKESQVYTIAVTATSGSLVQTTNVTLTVQ
jgi:hypothetical protein